MGVELQLAYDRLDDVQALFAEYTTVIAGQRADVATCLASQHYEEELQNLEGKYGLPGGRLYLAYLDGDCAGCGALTRNSPQYAELKRLYVRPRFRGRQIGRRLVEQLLAGGPPPPRRKPTFIVKDVRLFLNTITRSLDLMRSAGVDAQCRREDTEEEILLTIHIPRRAQR